MQPEVAHARRLELLPRDRQQPAGDVEADDARAPLRKELGQSMKRKTDAFRKAQLSRTNLEKELVDGNARASTKAAAAVVIGSLDAETVADVVAARGRAESVR